MISITIGLIILVALSTLFINQSRARIEMDKSNRMIDNGRYALQLLSDDLRLAGYYGEFVPVSGVPAVPAALPRPLLYLYNRYGKREWCICPSAGDPGC